MGFSTVGEIFNFCFALDVLLDLFNGVFTTSATFSVSVSVTSMRFVSSIFGIPDFPLAGAVVVAVVVVEISSIVSK